MTPTLVTVGEIAKMAGVGSSAVSNWRRRHGDFPLPVEEPSSGDLFDLDRVVDWLAKKGKPFDLPKRKVAEKLWRAVELLRGSLEVEQSVVTLLQLLYLQRCGQAHDTAAEQLSGIWKTMRRAENPLSTWRDAVAGFSEEEPRLARVLRPAQGLSESEISELVRIVEDPRDTDRSEASNAILEGYHDLLGRQGAGYTPAGVVDLMIELARPITGSVYDPASGNAMVLAAAWKSRESDSVRLFGQEVNEHSWRLGYLHLALEGAAFDMETGDTLRDDRFRGLQADRVLLDPPLGVKPALDISSDERWSYGIPQRNTDWLWAQQVIYHLAPRGIGLMLSTHRALVSRGYESEIRAKLVRSGKVSAVIDLPQGTLPNTSLAPSLLVLSTGSLVKDEVLFLDGRQLGRARRGSVHELTQQDIQKVCLTFHQWKAGAFSPEPRFSATADSSQVAEGGAVLSPTRYIQYVSRVDRIAGEHIPERLDRLVGGLERESESMETLVEGLVQQVSLLEPPGTSRAYPDTVRLGDLLTSPPATGIRQMEGSSDGSIPYITTDMVSGGRARIDTVPSERIQTKRSTALARQGDILLVSRGITEDHPVGCVVVAFNGEAAFSESLMRLSVDRRKADPDYIRLFLTSRQGRTGLASITTGTIVSNLRREALCEMEIPLPPLRTQQAITAIAVAIEEKLDILSRALELSSDVIDTLREGVVGGLLVPRAATTGVKG